MTKKKEKNVTVKQALEWVPKHPEWSGGTRVDSPVWENVARLLFDFSVNPDARVVGAVKKAIRSQKIILDRTTGTRRAGTHPALRSHVKLHMRDLTGGGINKEESDS